MPLNPEQFSLNGPPFTIPIGPSDVAIALNNPSTAVHITSDCNAEAFLSSVPNGSPFATIPALGSLTLKISGALYIRSTAAGSVTIQPLASNCGGNISSYFHNQAALNRVQQSLGKEISGGIDIVVAGDSIFEGYNVTKMSSRFSNILAQQLRVALDPNASYTYGEVMHTAVQTDSTFTALNASGNLSNAAQYAYYDSPGNWTTLAPQNTAYNGRQVYTTTSAAKMRWEIPAPCNITDLEYLFGINFNYGSGKLDVYNNVTGFQSGNGGLYSATLDMNGSGVHFNGRVHVGSINPAQSLVVQLTQVSGVMCSENLALYNGNYNNGVRVSNLSTASTATDFWNSQYPLVWGVANTGQIADPDVSTGGINRCKLWIHNSITNDILLNTNSGSTAPYMTPAQYAANLTAIYSAVSALPSAPSILHVIPPASSFAVNFDIVGTWGQFRDAGLQIASQFSNVAVLDLFGYSGDAPRSGMATALGWQYNSLHYVDAFHEFLASTITYQLLKG